MIKTVALGLAAVLWLAAPAAQAAEKVVTISADGKAVRAPVPEGLCEPTGLYVEHAKAVARLDDRNETLLTLYSCAEMAAGAEYITHYAHVKMPLSARGQTIPLKDVLASYTEQPTAFAKAINEGIDEAKIGDDFSEFFEADVKVESGLKPVGSDASGVYLAGTLSFEMNGKASTISVAAGLTSVHGKVLAFNIYGPGGTMGDVARQLRETKAATKALVAAN